MCTLFTLFLDLDKNAIAEALMDTYSILKTVHLIGVVMFLGNIVVTGWWKAMADRTRDSRIVAFAQRQVTLTDWVFTFGGVVLVAIGGIGNAMLHGLSLTAHWLQWGLAMFSLSGIIWAAVLIPLQTKQARMARGFATAEAIPQEYWQLARWWNAFGILATLLPLAVIPLMVYKIA